MPQPIPCLVFESRMQTPPAEETTPNPSPSGLPKPSPNKNVQAHEWNGQFDRPQKKWGFGNGPKEACILELLVQIDRGRSGRCGCCPVTSTSFDFQR